MRQADHLWSVLVVILSNMAICMLMGICLRTIGAVLLAGLLLPAGCSRKKSELEDGFQFARIMLLNTGKDPMAAGSLASIQEMGGHPVDYITACLPEEPRFSNYEKEAPTQPWCVVVKQGRRPREYVIEGYGEDLTKPLMEESIVIGEMQKH
jgi:hypothetical protein